MIVLEVLGREEFIAEIAETLIKWEQVESGQGMLSRLSIWKWTIEKRHSDIVSRMDGRQTSPA